MVRGNGKGIVYNLSQDRLTKIANGITLINAVSNKNGEEMKDGL
jgi:hypothetical protein